MANGQIIKKFIGNNQVGATQIALENDAALKARNAADSAYVDILKLNATDQAQFLLNPLLPADPTLALQAATKQYADLMIPLSQKGAINGVATLDGTGKIPSSQLTVDVVQYKGTWNANTNTPTLANGVGDQGDFYIVSVAGTTDFGAGPITFAVGDWALYNGTVWEKVVNSNAVTSVNGATGAVTVNAINELTGEVSTSAASGSESKVATVSNAAVIAKVLTGYVSGAGTISASDSILSAIQKLNGNIAALPAALTPATENFTGTASPGTLTLANTPNANTVIMSVRGAAPLQRGAGLDYTISGNVITLSAGLNALIAASDQIQVQYFY